MRVAADASLSGSHDEVVVESDQVLSGTGTFDGHVTNRGVVSPGHSPGIQNFDSFTQASDGMLQIELAGTDPGTGYDQINVSNLASLDGTLQVVLLDDFVPSAGDAFEIVTFGSVSGQFADGKGCAVLAMARCSLKSCSTPMGCSW